MLRKYYAATKDREFIREVLPWLDKEYNFWMTRRAIRISYDGKTHHVNIYSSAVDTPRPESFMEDVELLRDNCLDDDASRRLMQNIRAACETGWDFSSRWAGPGSEYGRKNSTLLDVLPQLKTICVIPVDLNSLMGYNERTLRDFHYSVGEHIKAMYYSNQYTKRAVAIESFMWSEKEGCYFDCFQTPDFELVHNEQFFPSNVHLLWSQVYPRSVKKAEREKRLVNYLDRTGALDYIGGIPTSLTRTVQQWDFDNAWPPLVHMVVEGLSKSSDMEIVKLARRQACKWVRTCYLAYKESNSMFEKMSTVHMKAGEGGEYDVQTGFGWSNGVILDLMRQHPTLRLEPDD
ncbi:MAG: hypothetical protein KVP17_003038 [Porospora cf. gigantea B]|nr:MAG: hypothetical protein KVP17_003038 [Porospora cf. gigantea B]